MIKWIEFVWVQTVHRTIDIKWKTFFFFCSSSLFSWTKINCIKSWRHFALRICLSLLANKSYKCTSIKVLYYAAPPNRKAIQFSCSICLYFQKIHTLNYQPVCSTSLLWIAVLNFKSFDILFFARNFCSHFAFSASWFTSPRTPATKAVECVGYKHEAYTKKCRWNESRRRPFTVLDTLPPVDVMQSHRHRLKNDLEIIFFPVLRLVQVDANDVSIPFEIWSTFFFAFGTVNLT